MNQTYEVYKERLSWVAVACLVIGIYSALTIFGSVSFYGWLTEEVVDALKIRALRNVLKQGAEYFDHPETSNAKLLQRISTDTTTLKAALDIRLYHQVSNAFCCIVEIAVAFSFCWRKFCCSIQIFHFIRLRSCTRRFGGVLSFIHNPGALGQTITLEHPEDSRNR